MRHPKGLYGWGVRKDAAILKGGQRHGIKSTVSAGAFGGKATGAKGKRNEWSGNGQKKSWGLACSGFEKNLDKYISRCDTKGGDISQCNVCGLGMVE